MSKRRRCALCNAILPPHAFYVVRIDVFAEPSMPPLDLEDLEELDPATTMAELIEQMKKMDPEELQDQVHRRFEYNICGDCQKQFLTNPLGKPRRTRAGEN